MTTSPLLNEILLGSYVPVKVESRIFSELLKVETPETLSCFVNRFGPVTVVIPAKVDKPETFNAVTDEIPPITLVAIPAVAE